MMAAGANWHPAPRQERRSWPIFVPLLIPLAVLAGFAVFVVLTPFTPTTKEPPPGRVGALIWGDGIFANNRELSAWLRLHGGSYSAWVKRHPHGVALITPRKRHAARKHKVAVAPPKTKAKPHRVAVAAPRPTVTIEKGSPRWLAAVLIAIGALFALVAMLPMSLLHTLAARAGRTSPPRLLGEFRLVAAAMGLAILAGVVLSAFLT